MTTQQATMFVFDSGIVFHKMSDGTCLINGTTKLTREEGETQLKQLIRGCTEYTQKTVPQLVVADKPDVVLNHLEKFCAQWVKDHPEFIKNLMENLIKDEVHPQRKLIRRIAMLGGMALGAWGLPFITGGGIGVSMAGGAWGIAASEIATAGAVGGAAAGHAVAKKLQK